MRIVSIAHSKQGKREHTFEQQPPKIRASIPAAARPCGMVSMMRRPARAMMREDVGRGSSMPYISAFSSEGAALMTLGTTASPSETADAWRSRRTAARRRGVGMEDADDVGALWESVLRFLAIQGPGTVRNPAGRGGLSQQHRVRRPAVAFGYGRARAERATTATATAEQARARPGSC